MQALERLGLKLKERIGLDELLGENFNPRIYGLTASQTAKVAALRDIVETYMTARENPKGKRIGSPMDAAMLPGRRMRKLQHEELWVAFLDGNKAVISIEMLFKGSLAEVHISHRDIIARALSRGASGIIMYHNHPSGCPLPGVADIEQTRQLMKACKVVGIEMLDHIVLGADRFYSFADEQTSGYRR